MRLFGNVRSVSLIKGVVAIIKRGLGFLVNEGDFVQRQGKHKPF